MNQSNICIHDQKSFEGMRVAGALAAETLDYITPYIQPGITTLEINDLIHNFILQKGGVPATLNYKGYTKSCCTSVNHVVCHGIPGNKRLKTGDIINIDVTPIYDGWHGDTSRMYTVGKVSIKAQKLIDTTYNAMMESIACIKPGVNLRTIGKTIQIYAESRGFSVVRDFCGHGIGKTFHAPPEVLHYDSPYMDLILEPGMFFTVEPMINGGGYAVKVLADGWTAVTRDRSLSAQFEHTIGVTETGYEIFTLSPKGWDYPPYKV